MAGNTCYLLRRRVAVSFIELACERRLIPDGGIQILFKLPALKGEALDGNAV